MKKIQALAFYLILCVSASAQSINPIVISSSGNSISASNVILDYTVGEISITTISTGANFLTQGFLQPLPTLSQGIKVLNENSFFVYPNPCRDMVFINSGVKKISKIILSDLQGKMIVSIQSKNLNLSTYPIGTYILSIYFEDNTISNTEIIKQ